MIRASSEAKRHVAVGFKKMFFPANVKAKEIVSRPDFGPITSITARYPQSLPPFEDRENPSKMIGFLDHIVHPSRWASERGLAQIGRGVAVAARCFSKK
jgi:predicted dehydrogenase